ncbi:MAG: UDP-N-acetylmuramate--L-alanine ligase [Anaerolineales bacterium]
MKGSTHFVGIGGTGLSAIARVLLERGEAVSGSDREDSPMMQSLRTAGAVVHVGHAASNVNGAVRVIRSSAVTDDNVEVQAARKKGIPVLKRSEVLGELLADQKVIAVAGSHGKTTTTAMIAWMLTALNQKPGYIIGSVAANLGANAAAGAGRLFVIEADEYDHMFLGLVPSIAVVTNVEHDHPDLFPEPRDFQKAFERFVDRLQPDGTLLACSDDPGAGELLAYAKKAGKRTLTYTSGQSGDYSMANLELREDSGASFMAMNTLVQLQVPGKHNALNALAALAVADLLQFSVPEAAMALSDFRGTARRFEERGEANGVLFVDDYAHHPTEIHSTLAAARARYPKRRIIAVWQPHTYSRTATLQVDFVTAFHDADLVMVTDVYAAREQKPAAFDMQKMAQSIKHPDLRFSGSLEETRKMLGTELKPGDLLLVMSAGDAIQISELLFRDLKQKEQAHA